METNGWNITPVIVVHGGAWTIPDAMLEPSREGVKAAARAGYQVLASGGSAIDAIHAAVRVLEDDTCFDAGTGSVLNSNGEVEMDAVIMDGKTLKSGAVACVQNILHPLDLARHVMEKTEHTLLVGKGANQYAERNGIKTVPTETLVSEEARREFKCFKQYGNTVETLFRHRQGIGHDTVGAVALDCNGNVAFGTSTGGITAKMPGRVGDSPIIGSGGYADNETGAVSCTGHGESIAKVCLAHRITVYMEQGMTAQQAAEKGVMMMADKVNGFGGVIVVGKDSDVGKFFTTEHMSWAYIKNDILHSGVDPDEEKEEKLNSSDD